MSVAAPHERTRSMDHETIAADDYNALPQLERERIGRFMEMERIRQLRRDRTKAAHLVAELSDEIRQCVAMLEKWPRHEPPNVELSGRPAPK